MKIVATSDIHGFLPTIPECDLLLIAGDITKDDWFTRLAPSPAANRKWQEIWCKGDFHNWLKMVPAKDIVGIAGNHDYVFQKRWTGDATPNLPWHYLHDTYVEIQGLKIWGAPWTKRLGIFAFELSDEELAQKWEEIPKDVDIIMVHGPVYGYGDLLGRPWPGEDPHSGCQNLMQRILENQFPNLKAVVTGHIHEGYGLVEDHGIKFINPSFMNLEFKPINPPIEFEL